MASTFDLFVIILAVLVNHYGDSESLPPKWFATARGLKNLFSLGKMTADRHAFKKYHLEREELGP